MDLQSLACFSAAAAEGSLSKAAQKLHYAQSNLSTKIMQLEDEMGCPLFYRNNHGVTLTPKGELLLRYAANLLTLADETMVAMKEGETAAGTIKIGSMESTVVSYLSGFLARYHRSNPRVAAKVETGTTEALLHKVLEYSLNGAFVAGPVNHPDLRTKPVRTEKLCLIASRALDGDGDLAALLTKPILVFPQGCSYRKNLEHWLKDEGVAANQVYEFNTLSALFASVTAGLGVALFPEECIRQYRQKEALAVFDVPEPYSLVPTVFVWRKDSYLSGALAGFINAIQ